MQHDVDAIIASWIAAHDRGDAQALAQAYASDADFIGIDGQVITGRETIEAMYSEVFRQLPGNKAKVTLGFRRLISDDVVIDDGTWEVDGYIPEGAPTKGRYTTIFEHRDGAWQIVCARTMVPVTMTALSG